ncbi:hypothetical protein BJX68DRAFT_273214 [Aspergillus pseudodeflectus]|uniref:Zn(2)-C6 fungal-type domain-containing protein n=1 Tax=Aspergillus pseudodeflectus TaxID=176178 RepID=A0ABR4JAJ9_9EURO
MPRKRSFSGFSFCRVPNAEAERSTIVAGDPRKLVDAAQDFRSPHRVESKVLTQERCLPPSTGYSQQRHGLYISNVAPAQESTESDQVQEMEQVRPLRDRAHVVCVECHARKVRCDLQDKPDKICSNCRRVNHPCVRRDGVRTRRKPASRRPASTGISAPGVPLDNGHSTTLVRPTRATSDDGAASTNTRLPKGFISHATVMHYDPLAEGVNAAATYPQSLDVTRSILSLTEADVLPRPSMLRALTDAYFQNVHPFYPIVDESDLVGSGASVLLQQAVCLAGSMTQHNSEMVLFCRSQYEKVKTLIYLNHEADNVAILKTNSDRLATACWGRPSAFRHLPDFDIPPLTEQDFPSRGRRPMVFLQALKLSGILDTITKISLDRSRMTSDAAKKSVDGLCNWIRNLPEELRLFGPDNARRAFWRPLVELHIWYFVTIILLQLLDSARFPWKIACSSFAAASCIARLYEEIECREETSRLLQIHGFFCMVAAVPLICHPHELQDVNTSREEEVDIICGVLSQMRRRYGGSDLVLRKIRRLRTEMSPDNGCTIGRQSNDADIRSMPATSSIQSRLDELFPFPHEFSSALTLLRADADYTGYIGGSQSELGDSEMYEFSSSAHMDLADMLLMDFPLDGFGSSGDSFTIDL